MRGSVPAAGVGLQPRGLICLGASNRGDRDLGAAAAHSECLSPAAVEDPPCTYRDIYT